VKSPFEGIGRRQAGLLLSTAALALSAGCLKQKESLIVVAITADLDLPSATTLSISAGKITQTYGISGLTQTTAVERGIYLDTKTTGQVTVSATTQGGTPCKIYSKSTTVNVAAGAIVNATLKLSGGDACGAVSDAATDTGGGVDGPAPDGGTGGFDAGSADARAPSLMSCTSYIHSIDTDCTSNTTVYGVAVSPNGQTVVTAGDDGRAKIWRFNGKTLTSAGLADLPSSAAGFGTLAFSPDGSILAIGWSDGVDLWNTTTWVRIRKLATPGSVYDIGFTPDGQQIMSIDSTNLHIHNIATPTVLHSIAIPEFTWLLAVSPIAATGTTTAAVALQDGTVRAFTHTATGFVANPTMLVTDPTAGTTRSVRFSRDGTLLAAGNELGQLFFWRYPLTSSMPTSPIVDVETPTTSGTLNWLAFSPDNRTIAVAGAYSPSVSTFAVAAPRGLIGLNRTPTDSLQSITYSPSGSALLAGGVTCGYVLVCAD